MIVGIGIDIVKIERVKSLYDKNTAEKFFTKNEIAYCEAQGLGLARSLAARFAAKEAFVKALGTGFVNINPIDIEVLNNEKGQPFINASSKIEKKLKEVGARKIHLSLSHEKEFALANVILEGDDVR